MIDRTSSRPLPAWMPGTERLGSWLQVLGAIVAVGGIQALVFHFQTDPLFAKADDSLAGLQREVPENRGMNAALEALQEYWRLTANEQRKREVLALRDAVLRSYAEDRAAAVHDLARAAESFDALSDSEQDVLAGLKRRTLELEETYADYPSRALDRYLNPPWYLQPTVAIMNNDLRVQRALEFNEVLYLMHTGDLAAAGQALEAMRRAESAGDKGRVAFAMARLRYDSFVSDRDPALFADALEFSRQSVRADPEAALPKLFLDFLLAADRRTLTLEVDPVEGEGSGESQGDRGAISRGREDF